MIFSDQELMVLRCQFTGEMQPINRTWYIYICSVLLLDSRRKNKELIRLDLERFLVKNIPAFSFSAIYKYELMTAFFPDPRVVGRIGIESDISDVQIPA
jgi:hypothetical protein